MRSAERKLDFRFTILLELNYLPISLSLFNRQLHTQVAFENGYSLIYIHISLPPLISTHISLYGRNHNVALRVSIGTWVLLMVSKWTKLFQK